MDSDTIAQSIDLANAAADKAVADNSITGKYVPGLC